jgi:CRISPR-associated endoribonuclease Cas6
MEEERGMPIKLRFALEGPDPVSPFRHATGLRAVTLDWIRRADPVLSQAIHDANQSKPFSISRLWSEEEVAMFEVAVLTDSLVAPLLEGIESAGKMVRLGPHTYFLREWQTFGAVTWEELLTPCPAAREFHFRIVSPTAHHAAGELRKSIVLPSPELYFGSWLGRWNVCCPAQFDMEAIRSLVEQQVAVKSCEGGTRVVMLDQGRPFIGFQGDVRFTLLKPDTVAPEARSALATLTRFAEYCGTGVDTMRGMGQTKTLFEQGDR